MHRGVFPFFLCKRKLTAACYIRFGCCFDFMEKEDEKEGYY